MVHMTMIVTLLLSIFSFKNLKIMSNRLNKEYKINGMLISFFILFLFAALRENYGNDYKNYEQIFLYAQRNINQFNTDNLFFIINRFFNSFHLMLAIFSFLYLYIVYKLIKTYVPKKYYWLSILIFIINPYLFFMSLSAIRQTLALCIFILALNIKVENRTKKLLIYALLMTIAFFIHKTSLLLIPIYFVYNAKKNNKLDMIIFILIPLLLLFSDNILVGLIKRFLDVFENNQTYIAYISNDNSNSIRSTFLFLLFYIYVLLNLHNLNDSQYRISKLYLIGLLFALLSYKISMFGRFQMYFDIFGVVALPAILNTLDSKKYKNKHIFFINRYIYPLLLFIIFILRYYSFFTTPLWTPFFEYHTFLF